MKQEQRGKPAPGSFSLKKNLLEAFTHSDGLVSAAVVVLGFLVGTLLILIVGRKPSGMYSAIVQVVTGIDLRRYVWNVRYIGEWLVMSMPLILCGFSMGFAARTGLFNIGAEGQYIAGLTVAQLVAVFFPQVPVLHWFTALAAALAAGAVWGGVVGWFKAKFSVSEVVATIMMNYIALYASRLITLNMPGANTYRVPDFPATAMIRSPFLERLSNGSRLNYGIWFTLAAAVFFWLVMGKTRLGYSLRATGLNREAARYGGISVNGSITSAMAISGAFAGLAGAVVALGSFSYGRVLAVQDGYGFDGIAVALVGNSTAWGTVLSGLLFGMLKSAQPLMQARQIPKEITSIIMGLVVVFISLRAGVRIIVNWQMKEKARKAGTPGGETSASGGADSGDAARNAALTGGEQ
ncbi:MAG: ABC transporter permease [Treponema sp.]|jgi:simple sugar transport system permease protein|nr:ABC transporter permease [Treponema sp.]